MTEREKIEREIILDILAESSKWRISEEDQNDDCIRLEVMDRARRLLLGTETVDENGYAQSHPETITTEVEVSAEPEVSPVITDDDFKALEATKVNEHLASPEKVDDARKQWESSKVRCSENGRLVWHPRSECQKVPRDTSKGGPSWKWQWMGPKDKKAQEDEMWAEHEAGNAE